MDSSEHGSSSPKQRLTLGFLISFMALCAKQAGRVSKKLKPKPKENGLASDSPRFFVRKPLLKSPRPKQLLATISNKAITLVHRKKPGEENGKDVGEEFGDGGVWQKAILMGDKCQPLDFSGVIYYDGKGNQLDELPIRSPRASPLPGYLAQRRP
ncbi:uncharacterized protein LOC111289723 [Durio zibethinus]|uniref:Uncharacterized protein LOC111289723 n=1 Tax=Durio zibethinus TaxID=66656 RepID=A0A6P5Y8I0_DURZI|nr:uncharacterized protein LOC111289723 [Durio zibethinus]